MIAIVNFFFNIFISKLKRSIFFLISSFFIFSYFYKKKLIVSGSMILWDYSFTVNTSYVYLVLIFNIVPFIFFWRSKEERGNLPLFYLSLVYILFSYTFFLLFNSWGYFPKYSPTQHNSAIKVLLSGLIFYNLGYFLFFKFINKKREGLKILKIDKNKELLILGLLTSLGVIFFYYIIDISNYISGIQQLKFPLIYISYGSLILYISNSKQKISIYLISLISISILIPVACDMLNGSYFGPFISLFLTLIFYLYLKQKIKLINISFFALLVLIFVLFIGTKDDYRKKTWHRSNTDFDNSQFTIVNKVLIYKKLIYSNLKELNFNQKTLMRRIYHSYQSLLIVTSMSPKEVDFWQGGSYKILASKIIPRVFWKNKPSDVLGNEFGHRYNELDHYDKTTSWNMPVLNEFYVNYGLIGVSIGMFLLGIIFRFFSTFFSINDKNNIEKVISFYIFMPLFFLESHLSILFGAVIQSYIFLLIFFIMYKKVFKYLRII